MTRREELAARARDYVSLFARSGAEPAATKNLAWMLEQVEREVWERVKKRYHCHEYMSDHRTFGGWLTAQQQDLEP